MVRLDDAVDIRWRPLVGPAKKSSFRPRSDGRWDRIELQWSGCRWVEQSHEIVEDVALEHAAAVPIDVE